MRNRLNPCIGGQLPSDCDLGVRSRLDSSGGAGTGSRPSLRSALVSNYLCPECQVVLTFAPDSPTPATDAAGGIHVVTGVCSSCGGLFGRRYGAIVPVTPTDNPLPT